MRCELQSVAIVFVPALLAEGAEGAPVLRARGMEAVRAVELRDEAVPEVCEADGARGVLAGCSTGFAARERIVRNIYGTVPTGGASTPAVDAVEEDVVAGRGECAQVAEDDE